MKVAFSILLLAATTVAASDYDACVAVCNEQHLQCVDDAENDSTGVMDDEMIKSVKNACALTLAGGCACYNDEEPTEVGEWDDLCGCAGACSATWESDDDYQECVEEICDQFLPESYGICTSDCVDMEALANKTLSDCMADNDCSECMTDVCPGWESCNDEDDSETCCGEDVDSEEVDLCALDDDERQCIADCMPADACVEERSIQMRKLFWG